MFVFDAPVGAAYQVVNGLAERLGPAAGGMSAVLAIVLCTVAVRLRRLRHRRSLSSVMGYR